MTDARTILDAITALRGMMVAAKAADAAALAGHRLDWRAHYDALGAASLAIQGLEGLLCEVAGPALVERLGTPQIAPADLATIRAFLRPEPARSNVVPLRVGAECGA